MSRAPFAAVVVLASLMLNNAFTHSARAAAVPTEAQMEHGCQLYFQNCLTCHQLAGQGENAAGKYEANIHAVLAPLGRPIDVHLAGWGKIYICEFTRPTNNKLSYALPGRILELAVKPK